MPRVPLGPDTRAMAQTALNVVGARQRATEIRQRGQELEFRQEEAARAGARTQRDQELRELTIQLGERERSFRRAQSVEKTMQQRAELGVQYGLRFDPTTGQWEVDPEAEDVGGVAGFKQTMQAARLALDQQKLTFQFRELEAKYGKSAKYDKAVGDLEKELDKLHKDRSALLSKWRAMKRAGDTDSTVMDTYLGELRYVGERIINSGAALQRARQMQELQEAKMEVARDNPEAALDTLAGAPMPTEPTPLAIPGPDPYQLDGQPLWVLRKKMTRIDTEDGRSELLRRGANPDQLRVELAVRLMELEEEASEEERRWEEEAQPPRGSEAVMARLRGEGVPIPGVPEPGSEHVIEKLLSEGVRLTPPIEEQIRQVAGPPAPTQARSR